MLLDMSEIGFPEWIKMTLVVEMVMIWMVWFQIYGYIMLHII